MVKAIDFTIENVAGAGATVTLPATGDSKLGADRVTNPSNAIGDHIVKSKNNELFRVNLDPIGKVIITPAAVDRDGSSFEVIVRMNQ